MINVRYFLFIFILCANRVSGLDLDVNVFSYFADRPYAEIHLRVNVHSVKQIVEEGQNKSGIEFLIVVNDQNNNPIYGDKFLLHGVVSEERKDFITIKRFYIPSGNYSLYILATDIHEPENKLELERQFSVLPDWEGAYGLSDPVLMANKNQLAEGMDENAGRHGYIVEPLPYGFADTMHAVVYFLQEIYMPALDTHQTYFLNYTISGDYKESLTAKVLLSQYKKLEPLAFQYVLIPLQLKELPSGQYHLSTHLQTIDKRKLSTRKVNFFKSNPMADLVLLELDQNEETSFVSQIPSGELDYILKAHVPITNNIQLPTLQTIIKGSSDKRKRKFIHQFWNNRSPANAGEDFKKYMEVAKAVDREYYSSVGYGFQTHRGHIFLKHGKPSNVLSIDTEPDAPPYEIWYYNKIQTTKQTNVRFLFYNESLSHNDFWLLHSTCYGERNNPAWETELYNSVPEDKIGNTIDATEVKGGWNRQAKIYFNQF